MVQNSYNYAQRKSVRPISWEDFHGICKALALVVSRFEPEIILPIGRGGYYPGTLLAHILQVEIYPVRLSRRVNDDVRYKNPRWLIKPPVRIKNRRILVVDEICSQGETLSVVKNRVKSMGASSVKSAVLYSHSWSADIPDYIGLITDELLINPWDREVLQNGTFRVHPEYAEALSAQGLRINSMPLIHATPFVLAKG